MKSRSRRFNIYLLGLMLTAVAGCKTPEESRIENTKAVLRFYVEATPDGLDRYQKVDIAGVQFNATKSHVLDESSLSRVAVVSTRDRGYALQVDFDDHGKLVLDAITSEARGKHLIIFTQFGVKKTVQDRWLAAPLITRRISNGQIVFSPNATREEADEIALGLNNVIAKRVNKPWWW
jgi:preprotein translocase subunit SecD